MGKFHILRNAKLFKYISIVQFMNNTNKKILGIFGRYLFLVLIAFSSLLIFYTIFTPLTVYPVYFLLNLFFDVTLISKIMIIVEQKISIELIEACIAGSAYYLLLILNLTTSGIKTKTRMYLILFSFSSFLVINILRIFLLSLLAISNSPFFRIAHVVFWYLLSTLFIVGIWFLQVKIFKIKNMPLYEDIKFLYGLSKRKKGKIMKKRKRMNN